jgi:HD-like signal output (HDOD) protein/CheY-like chemotaxis protein
MKNLLFVDDEPKVLQGLQRQLHAMRREWNMNFAGGGPAALEFMATHPVDVIITDMIMPGMDGSQLLSEVAKRHAGTVRIVLSGQAGREAILRLVGPAHQYLSKPCEAAELRNAIARALALQNMLSNEQLKQLATRIKCLPSLPALYHRLTEELQRDKPSIERISDIISRDPAMAAKILQLVNSAFFGLPQSVTSLTDAVTYLGLTTVRSLVLSWQVFSQFDPQLNRGFSIDALAHHCWLTGMVARRVARAEQQDEIVCSQCFLAGLLHDVGQLILATGLPEEYARVRLLARQQNRPIQQTEQELFGATHADVGGYLLGLWGLPTAITEAVALHHCPSLSFVPQFSPVVAVHVADVFMHEQPGASTEEPPPTLDLDHLTSLGLAGRLETWRALSRGGEEF